MKECFFLRRTDTSQYLSEVDKLAQVPRWTDEIDTALHFIKEDEISAISSLVCESLGDRLNLSELVFVDEFFVENNKYTLIDSHPLNSY